MTQDTFESGVFDCVSGSLILAGLLDYFGFDFKIVETTHHVFLEVEISDEVVLFEVTDPLDGFIIDNESKKIILNLSNQKEVVLIKRIFKLFHQKENLLIFIEM